MSKVSRVARRVHRIAAYLVGIQVLLWVLGGLVFAWVPFDSIIKGGDAVRAEPAQALPPEWAVHLRSASVEMGEATSIATYASAQGPLLRVGTADSSYWLRLQDGAVNSTPDAASIARFAATLYRGTGRPGAPRYLAASETRVLGLVDELYGRTGVWQVPFDDSVGTRLYFDGGTGRYVTVRNDFWVLYDAMWRLHIMDYRGGEDFNNPLLTIFASLAGIFVASGVVLAVLALRRALRPRAGTA